MKRNLSQSFYSQLPETIETQFAKTVSGLQSEVNVSTNIICIIFPGVLANYVQMFKCVVYKITTYYIYADGTKLYVSLTLLFDSHFVQWLKWQNKCSCTGQRWRRSFFGNWDCIFGEICPIFCLFIFLFLLRWSTKKQERRACQAPSIQLYLRLWRRSTLKRLLSCRVRYLNSLISHVSEVSIHLVIGSKPVYINRGIAFPTWCKLWGTFTIK